MRRTTHLDIGWSGRRLELVGAARDLATTASGAEVLDQASMRAMTTSGGRLESLTLSPGQPGAVDGLIGEPVRSGFRARLRSLLPDVAGSPLGVLLEDVPGAALISGYVQLRTGSLGGSRGKDLPSPVIAGMVDVCSGWRAEGRAVRSLLAGDGVPVQDCPPAPEADADALAWHPIGPLGAHGMRRCRRIDLAGGGDAYTVDAMFRDTFGESDGTEVVLHEYAVAASFKGPELVVSALEATPRVLPFGECPLAAPFVEDLVGVPASELRKAVPDRLGGVRGCTHLNDLLRVLADVGWLAARLPVAAERAGKEPPG